MSLARRALSLFVLALVSANSALALEVPVGKPQHQAGMEVAVVYLQPVVMEPDGMMRRAADSDIHLEADIHAQSDNANGFADGAWMPYLGVTYEITKQGATQKLTRRHDADGGQ